MGYTFRLCSASAIIPITWTRWWRWCRWPRRRPGRSRCWRPAQGDHERRRLGIDAARAQYRAWLAIAEASDWRTPQDVKRSHPKASILKGGRVVFNIKANDYRLIALVQYRDGVLIIRFFGSHEDYDKVNAEAV